MKAQWLIRSVVALSSRAATSARNAFARAMVSSGGSIPGCHHRRGRWPKCVMRESRGQKIRRASHIAHEGGTLAHLVHNIDGRIVPSEERLRGLQGARVGRHDDPRERGAGKLLGGCGGLFHAERRQLRILDPWVDARAIEVQVKIALAVAE